MLVRAGEKRVFAFLDFRSSKGLGSSRACSPHNFLPPSLPTQISLITSTRDSKALFTTSLTPLHFEHSQAMENLGSSPRKMVPGFLRRCLNSKCPSSGQVSALVFTPDMTFPFLLEMRCDYCNAKVHICSTCSNTKIQFSSQGQILSHCRFNERPNHHCIWPLLPLLQSKLKPGEDMYITHRFSLVSSDHRTLDQSGHLS